MTQVTINVAADDL